MAILLSIVGLPTLRESSCLNCLISEFISAAGTSTTELLMYGRKEKVKLVELTCI